MSAKGKGGISETNIPKTALHTQYKFDRSLFYLTAQEGSVSFLLDLGVGVGVFDDTGMSAIGVMIEKMPHVAYEALNQYQDRDVARRVDQFYLNYLEQVRV